MAYRCADSGTHPYHDISCVVHISCRADGLFQLGQRKLVGDDAFQIPPAAGHDFLYGLHILRHVAAGADDTLLGVSHVRQVDAAGLIIYRHRDEAAFNFPQTQEVIQNAFCAGGVQPAVDIGGGAAERRRCAEISFGLCGKILC